MIETKKSNRTFLNRKEYSERERYFFLIESFLQVVYEILVRPGTFFYHAREYLELYLRKKLKDFVISLTIYFLALGFLLFSLFFLLQSLFYFLDEKIQSPLWSSFFVAWFSFLLAIFIFSIRSITKNKNTRGNYARKI